LVRRDTLLTEPPVRHLLVLAGAVAVLGGCSVARTTSLAIAAIDTLPGGVIHVTNPGPGRWMDTSGWKLVLERTIHPAAGSPGELGEPSGVVASRSGDAFVMERKPAMIKHYGPNGDFLGTIGREGAGPGEFGDYGVLYIAHDTLVHQDAGHSRMSVFTTAGSYVRAWPSSQIAERDLVADTSGRIPIPASSETTKINSGHGVVRFGLDGSASDSIWYPPAPEPQVWRLKNERSDFGMLVPYVPDRVNLLDQGGRLIWGDQGKARFYYSRTGRDTVRIVDATLTAAPLPDSLRQSAYDDAVKRNAWLEGIARIADIPRTYPLWTAMVSDGANNLWVLLPGPRGEADHWQVFDPDGRLLGAVPAPFDHADRTFWTSDRVYVMTTAADGTPAIDVYRIVKGAT
jgi:hypothetical protein